MSKQIVGRLVFTLKLCWFLLGVVVMLAGLGWAGLRAVCAGDGAVPQGRRDFVARAARVAGAPKAVAEALTGPMSANSAPALQAPIEVLSTVELGDIVQACSTTLAVNVPGRNDPQATATIVNVSTATPQGSQNITEVSNTGCSSNGSPCTVTVRLTGRVTGDTTGQISVTGGYFVNGHLISTHVLIIPLHGTVLAPALSCPADINTSATPGSCLANVNIVPPPAPASCYAAPSGTRSDGQLLTAPYPVGMTTITWNSSATLSGIPYTATCSQKVNVTESTPTNINAPPQPQTACAGQAASFSVGATGVGLTYQWRKGGQAINGATQSTYTIASTTTNHAGAYSVVIGSACSAPVTSNAVSLTVNPTTAVNTPPASQVKTIGQSVSFNVVADGANLGYQWRKGGQAINGATQSSYTINAVALADAAQYDVVVTGACGTATSSPATLTVNCQPITVSNPATTTGAAGVAFNQAFTQGGGNGTTTFSTTSQLPNGLILASNGALSGTPTQVGTFPIVVTATDQNGCTGMGATYNLNITCVVDPVVLNNGDNGAGSLRMAIADACPGSTITFAGGLSLITLTSGELVINKNLTIQGLGANALTISGNQTSRIFSIGSGVTVALDGLTIANGKLSSSSLNLGGGILNLGLLTITNSTISGNSASNGSFNHGGGIYNDSSGALSLTNSTLSGNSISGPIENNGGAIYNRSGILMIRNSTLSGNSIIGGSGQSYGGGIYNYLGGVVNLTHTTISNNSTSGGGANGGGIFNEGGTVSSGNSIIAGNTAPNGQDFFGTLSSVGFNLIGNTNSTTINGATTGNLLNTNAGLAPLGNYGGPTQTHALLPGSPALNAGSNALAVEENNQPLPTDQRGAGFNRQVGGTVDIGAFESRGFTLAYNGGNNQSAGLNAAFANALAVSVSSSFGEPVQGGSINFTPPPSGASATLTSTPATISGAGQASVTATANATAGSYSVTAGANGLTSVSFMLSNTCPGITVGTPTATGALGTAYNSSVTATPAAPNGFSYQYSLANGTSLPAGLSLNATTGAITGTPTAPGQVNFTIKVELFNSDTATGCVVTQSYSLNITCTSNPQVTMNADSGAGSLRDAIALACPGSTIAFAKEISLITLTSGELAIHKSLTIQGPGAHALTISGNQASRIFLIGSGVTVTLDALMIANGKLSDGGNLNQGGGIFNSGTLTITNSTISGNSVSGGFGGGGGGIANIGALTLSHSTLSANSARSGAYNYGGGIYNSGTLTLSHSTLSGNSASGGAQNNGGGISNFSGTLKVTNSTISGNSVSGGNLNYGGGIYHDNFGMVKITNSTLSANSVTGPSFANGGGIFGTASSRNTIIAGNTASNEAPDFSGTLNSEGFNLIGNTIGTGIIGTTTGNLLNTAALLAPLGNYGGPTQTHALLPGSPALNAGSNALAVDANNQPLTTDQRGAGFNRQVGGTVDIGAFEANYALAATGGTPQSTAVNTPFTTALQATLTESGNPVSGVPLTFTAPSSGASATLSTPNPATTNSNGQASVTATANAVPGMYAVSVNAPGLTASFNLTNTAGPPAKLIFAQAPTNASAGAAIAPAVQVQILDAANNLTNATANVTLVIGTNPGGGTLSGTTTIAAVNGTATFSNLSINKIGTGYTLNATSNGLIGATSAAFNLTPAAAAKLVFGTQPTTASAGSALTPAVTVRILDAFDNQTAATNAVTLALGANPGGSTLSGTTMVAAVSGTATFSNLSLNKSGSGYTLAATNGGLTGATSNSFNITAGAAASLMATGAAGQSAALNTAFPTALQVTVKDSFGNVVSGVQVTFTAPASGASVTFPNSNTVTTNASGQASVNVKANGTAGTYNVAASANSLPSVNFTLTNVAPPTVAKSFSPATISPGGTSQLTLNFSNPAGNVALNNLAVTDNLPPGLSVAATPGLNNTCGFTVNGATPGSSSASLTGGMLAAGPSACQVQINVTSITLGAAQNTTGFVSAIGNGVNLIGNQAQATLQVNCPTLTINPATVPNGGVGLAYPATSFTATGGTAPYNFNLSQGTLPAGLNFTGGANAQLTGTPSAGGAFNFTIAVSDKFGCTAQRAYTLVINRPPSLAAISPKAVAPGQPLSFTATASDPDLADTLSYALNGAPAGATINPATGQFSWTPTPAQLGAHSFNVVVTDNGSPALAHSQPLVVNVGNLVPALTLSVAFVNTNPANVGLSAQLRDSVSQAAIPGKLINFSIGTRTATGTTDGNGVALGQISVPAPGAYAAKASFAGDAAYPPAMTVTSFNLTQGGQSCAFTRTPASQSFAANGGTGTVQLATQASNCNWSAASAVPWITLTSGLGGTGNGTVSYTVAANPTTAPRSGTLYLAGQTFTVVQGVQFNDVPLGHAFYTEIGKLAARGVTLGCGGGNYCPDAAVTREQMAAFLLRGLGEFTPPLPATQRFLDVPASNPFYAFIEQMAQRGITQGCGGGNYCPTGQVTREQMAAFLIRALNAPGYVPPTPAQQRFLDVPPGNPFYGFIEEMATRGITLGCGGGNYCPAAIVTRAQMAVFLVRAFGL